MKLRTYQVVSGDVWMDVRGVVTPKGWLDWNTRDGDVGLTPPGKWREKPSVPKKEHGK